jgi:hypothetical protein
LSFTLPDIRSREYPATDLAGIRRPRVHPLIRTSGIAARGRDASYDIGESAVYEGEDLTDLNLFTETVALIGLAAVLLAWCVRAPRSTIRSSSLDTRAMEGVRSG